MGGGVNKIGLKFIVTIGKLSFGEMLLDKLTKHPIRVDYPRILELYLHSVTCEIRVLKISIATLNLVIC